MPRSLDLDRLVDLATLRAHDYGVPATDWRSLLEHLTPLRQHSPETFAHSLRVGLYAGALAAAEGHNASYALGGGCAHDIGKLAVSNDVLRADPFTDADFALVQKHATVGFMLLNAEHPLLALVAGLHHQFQPRAYGIGLDHPSFISLPEPAQRHVLGVVGIVMACDVYDATTTRADQHHPHTTSGARRVLLAREMPERRIDWLVAHDIASLR